MLQPRGGRGPARGRWRLLPSAAALLSVGVMLGRWSAGTLPRRTPIDSVVTLPLVGGVDSRIAGTVGTVTEPEMGTFGASRAGQGDQGQDYVYLDEGRSYAGSQTHDQPPARKGSVLLLQCDSRGLEVPKSLEKALRYDPEKKDEYKAFRDSVQGYWTLSAHINGLYAMMHPGYHYRHVQVTKDDLDGRHASWCGVRLALDLLEHYEYILVLDGDAVMSTDKPLSVFLDYEHQLVNDKYLLVTENDNELGKANPWPINAGIFMVRSSEASRTILQEWWDAPLRNATTHGRFTREYPWEQQVLADFVNAKYHHNLLVHNRTLINGPTGKFIKHFWFGRGQFRSDAFKSVTHKPDEDYASPAGDDQESFKWRWKRMREVLVAMASAYMNGVLRASEPRIRSVSEHDRRELLLP